MTGDLSVSRIRAWAVTPETSMRVRYHGRMDREPVNIELVRVDLANGCYGAASFLSGYRGRGGGSVVAKAEAAAGAVLGSDAARRSATTSALLDAAGEGPWEGISLLDCALWDAYGRSVGLPVWRLLGGYRERIPAYASTEAFLTIEEYLDEAKRLVAMGYPAIKFHMNTDPDFDLELVRVITHAYGEGKIRFMTDQEQLNSFDEAVRLGEAMSRGPFDWLEAPMPDKELDAYVELNSAVAVDVLPAGNTLVRLEQWREGLARKAWSRLRFDAGNSGGITGAMQGMGLARAYGVPVEIQSYGYQPAQVANLHVMLGMMGCTWFEHPVPAQPFDFPVTNPVTIDAQGCVSAPSATGFGFEIDWSMVEAEAFACFDSVG